MTKKDFFRLIIKLFGLYFAISLLTSLFLGNVIYVLNDFDLVGLIWLIVSIAFIFFLLRFLIFKNDKLIQWLKLDKGFDDDKIEFQNFNTENILKLATIVIGGILLINNIPGFLSYTLFAFKSTVGNTFYSSNDVRYLDTRQYVNWGECFFKIVIGYLILTNYNQVSKLLKTKNTEEE